MNPIHARLQRLTWLEVVIIVLIFITISLVAYAVWLERTHPCRQRGPAQTTFIPVYCGENCTTIVPTTTYPCLERD